MREWGCSTAEIEDRRREFETRVDARHWVEVYPANVDAFRVFDLLEPQWEFPGAMGGRLAVALTEVEAAMRLLRIRDRVDCFGRVRAMLAVATPIIRQKLKEATGG